MKIDLTPLPKYATEAPRIGVSQYLIIMQHDINMIMFTDSMAVIVEAMRISGNVNPRAPRLSRGITCVRIELSRCDRNMTENS